MNSVILASGEVGIFAAVIIVVVVLALLASCIKIVPQTQAFVIERLGGYKCTDRKSVV